MKNTTSTQSNYTDNYNSIQLVLPLNLEILIDEDDSVVSFLEVMEDINLNKYLKRQETRGRTGYNRINLLKAVLFARMEKVSELRQLESLCRHDIRFMYIMQEEQPSFMAFQRFIKNFLIKDIDEIFYEISSHIARLTGADTSIQYIDGTKVESNANKYSFVYKKRIFNSRDKLYIKITDLIHDMNQSFGHMYDTHEKYCSLEIGFIAQYLMDVMVHDKVKIVYGRGCRKSKIQKYYDKFLEYALKLDEYEYWLSIIDERNSCSKTDHDATMCATKIDYYCNTGLSRPCYNAQIGVSDGIIVNSDIYQNPGDTKTFIPFMERYHHYMGEYPQYPMADAAYGSYDNYMFCITHNLELYMKYGMYAKKNTPKFKKITYHPLNWDVNDEGYKVCPEGKVFDNYIGDKYDNDGSYLKISELYTHNDTCVTCPHQKECYKGTKERKTLSRNIVLNQMQELVDENLSTDFGKELKKQRSIQVEGAFGVIKQDMDFTRFKRRGLENVKMEFLIVCLGYNFRKYHAYRIKNKKNSYSQLSN